MQLFKKPLKG